MEKTRDVFKKIEIPREHFMQVQFSSLSQSFSTLCDHTDAQLPSPSPTLTQTHVHRVGDAIQSSHPLLSASPPAFKLSQHQDLFQWVSSSHQVAKVLEFRFQHQSFQRIFRTDALQNWLFYLLAVQRTLKSLLQHHNLKASVLQCSAFFMVQLSHP